MRDGAALPECCLSIGNTHSFSLCATWQHLMCNVLAVCVVYSYCESAGWLMPLSLPVRCNPTRHRPGPAGRGPRRRPRRRSASRAGARSCQRLCAGVDRALSVPAFEEEHSCQRYQLGVHVEECVTTFSQLRLSSPHCCHICTERMVDASSPS